MTVHFGSKDPPFRTRLLGNTLSTTLNYIYPAIFSKIQISEMYRANLSLVTGRLVRRSTRTYFKPGTGNQNSWMHGYKISLHHSPEVYVLSGYALGLMIVMAWT